MLLLFAGAIAFGASRCGLVALGAHDDHPTPMSASQAAGQPLNRWVTVTGRVDGNTLYKSSHLGADAVAFRIKDGGSLILVTDTNQHPMLTDAALWQPGFLARVTQGENDAPTALSPATLGFLTSDQTFTGIISEPGLGMDQSDEVSVHDHSMKIKGTFSGYCAKVRGCPATPIVLLIGESPRSRLSSWAGMIALGLLSLFLLAAAVSVFRRKRA